MHADEHQQRVVGQLVLALRESRLLPGARDIEYELDEHGTVVITWVEGPRADEVAAGLAAYSAAGLLEVDAVAPDMRSSEVRANLLVSGLPVLLMAYEPIGLERASRRGRPRRAQPEWTWPTPLADDGACRDTVLWTLDRDDGMVATVVRLPFDRPFGWSEGGVLIALPEEDAPEGVWLTRRLDVDRAREKCSILLRFAPRDLTVDAADDWMAAELNSKHALRLATAVVWHDRCLVRRWSGLRMEVTCDGTHGVPWSHVPAAVLSSMWHPKPCRKQPPATMKVREFGDVHTVATVAVASTWCAPSEYYVNSPVGGV